MSSKDQYVPRLSIDVSPETLKRWEDLLPWGIRSKVVRVLVEDVLNMIEAEGEIVIAMILARKLKGSDIIKMGERNGHTGPEEKRD